MAGSAAKQQLARAKKKARLEALYQEGCRRLREYEVGSETPPFKKVLDALKTENPGLTLKYHTLRRRYLNESKPANKAHEQQQLLDEAQERVLVSWVIFYSNVGQPLDKNALRTKAKVLCGKKPSKGWIRLFLLRHPDLKLGRPSGLDAKRARAFNRPTVEHHCALLKAFIEKFGIPVENVYNMDEKGCQRGGGRKLSGRKYIIPRSDRPSYRDKNDCLELITIIECVCADGCSIKPGFIFSGSQFSPEWFDVHDDIFVGTSENGWTDDFLCSEWFHKSFIPQTKARNTSGRPILLILDGHGSHETIRIIDLALSHNIIIFCLPPHTTHKLQALDVGVFGPFSRAFADLCDSLLETYPDGMPREDFVKYYMAVRKDTFKPTTIQNAFRKSSSWPVDATIFTEEDYAPSFRTSTTYGHVPPSYPSSDDPSAVNASHRPTTETGFQHINVPGSEDRDRPAVETDGEEDASDEEEDDDGEDEDTESPSTSTAPSANTPVTVPPAHDPYNLLDDIAAIIESVPRPPTGSASSTASCIPLSDAPSASDKPVSRVESLQLELERVRAERDRAVLQAREAHAHCAMAEDQIVMLKRKDHARETAPRKRQKLVTTSRCLNSRDGRAEEYARDAKRMVAAQKKQDVAAAKQAKAVQREQARLARGPGHNFVWTGTLSSKLKPDLEDIADDLGISKAGKKDEIYARLVSYFNDNPSKRQDARYIQLLPSRGRRRNDENVTPAPAPSNLNPTLPSTSSASFAVVASSSTPSRPSHPLPTPHDPHLPPTILVDSNTYNISRPYPISAPFNSPSPFPSTSGQSPHPHSSYPYQLSASGYNLGTPLYDPYAQPRASAHTTAQTHSFTTPSSRFTPY